MAKNIRGKEKAGEKRAYGAKTKRASVQEWVRKRERKWGEGKYGKKQKKKKSFGYQYINNVF